MGVFSHRERRESSGNLLTSFDISQIGVIGKQSFAMLSSKISSCTTDNFPHRLALDIFQSFPTKISRYPGGEFKNQCYDMHFKYLSANSLRYFDDFIIRQVWETRLWLPCKYLQTEPNKTNNWCQDRYHPITYIFQYSY